MPPQLDFVHPDLVVCSVGSSGYGVVAKQNESSDNSSVQSSSSAAVIFRKGDLLVDCGPIALQIDGRRCSECGAEPAQNQKFMKCGDCKAAYFCSRECQRESLSSIHNIECKLLGHIEPLSKVLQDENGFPSRSGQNVRLAAIIMAKICSELGLSLLDLSTVLLKDFRNPEAQVCLKDVYRSSQQLSLTLATISLMAPPLSDDSPVHIRVEEKEALDTLLMAVLVHSKHSDKKDMIDLREKTMNLVTKVLQNAFKIMNWQVSSHNLQASGYALYPFAHLFNHSCYYNTRQAFHGQRLQLRAVRDIYEGDEITNSYISGGQPVTERVDQVSKFYGFKCECLVCHNGGPFQNAYNLSLENPLCPTCLVEYYSIPKSEPWCSNNACSPLLFSADWFEDLRVLYNRVVPYGCSASSVSNIRLSTSSFPSSISSLLTNPPLMIKLSEVKSKSSPTLVTRQCARCKGKETNGFFDRCLATFDQPRLSMILNSLFRLLNKTTTGLQMTEDYFQQLCLPITKLLTQCNFDIRADSSFPPQLFQFLLCSRTSQLFECFTNLQVKLDKQQKIQLLPFFLLSIANNFGTVASCAFGFKLLEFGCSLSSCRSACGTVLNHFMLQEAIPCLDTSLKILRIYGPAFEETIKEGEVNLKKAQDQLKKAQKRALRGGPTGSK